MKNDDAITKSLENTKNASPKDIVSEWIGVIDNLKTNDRKIKEKFHPIKGFRTETPLQVYSIDHKIFKYRITNGRLRGDVITDETLRGEKYSYSSESDQKLIEKYLINNFKDRHEELKLLLIQNGQEVPLISRCDGVIINGNRRLAAIRSLVDKPKGKDLQKVEVIFLPQDATELEIRKIERKLQFQATGDAPYNDFNKAILILESEEVYGWKIRDQLLDDDTYAGLEDDEFNKKMTDYIKDFITPLKFTNKYLERLNAAEIFNLVRGKKGGRWQAIREFSKYYDNLENDFRKTRTKIGIKRSDVPKIEDAAHRVIRKQEFGKDFRDLNGAMRVFKNCLSRIESRQILFDLLKVEMPNYPDDCTELDDFQTFDEKWKSDKDQGIKVENILKKAYGIYKAKSEKRNIIDVIKEFRDFIYSEQFNEDELNIIFKAFSSDEVKEVHDLLDNINRVIPDMKKLFWNKYKGKTEDYNKALKLLVKKFMLSEE